MKPIHQMFSFTRVLSVACVSGLLLATGCGRQSSTSAPTPKIVSAEKTTFAEVTAHLDAGGSLYGYVSAAQFMSGLSTQADGLRDVLLAGPLAGSNERENAEKAFRLLGNVLRQSGLEGITGVGFSGIALETNFYQTKLFVHRTPAAASGYLWTLPGAKARPLAELDWLPADTAWALFGDFDLPGLWNGVRKELTAAGLEEGIEGLEELSEMVEMTTGQKLEDLIGSFGGQQGLILTLDTTRQVRVPLPDGETLELPEPGLILAVRVKDDRLFDLIDGAVKEMPGVVVMDADGIRARSMPVPLPIPISLRPTVARWQDYLLIASNEELVKGLAAVKAGTKPGLRSQPEFQKLSKDMPTEGNQFGFVSERLGGALQQVQKTAMRQAVAQNADMPLDLMERLAGGPTPSMYFVGAHVADGWLVTGRGNQNPSTMLILPAVVMPTAILAGMTVPALAKAKERAQSVACVNNMKQIAIGALLYANDHDDLLPADFSAMREELGSSRILVCPADGTEDDGSFATTSYELVIKSRKLSDISDTSATVLLRCNHHGHEAFVDGRVETGGN